MIHCVYIQRAGPQHAVVFVCYEWIKRTFFPTDDNIYNNEDDTDEIQYA